MEEFINNSRKGRPFVTSDQATSFHRSAEPSMFLNSSVTTQLPSVKQRSQQKNTAVSTAIRVSKKSLLEQLTLYQFFNFMILVLLLQH